MSLLSSFQFANFTYSNCMIQTAGVQGERPVFRLFLVSLFFSFGRKGRVGGQEPLPLESAFGGRHCTDVGDLWAPRPLTGGAPIQQTLFVAPPHTPPRVVLLQGRLVRAFPFHALPFRVLQPLSDGRLFLLRGPARLGLGSHRSGHSHPPESFPPCAAGFPAPRERDTI